MRYDPSIGAIIKWNYLLLLKLLCVINCNLTLNIKLCKRRFSFTFYFASVGNYKMVIFRSKPKIRLIDTEIVCRFKKWFQSWKSDYKELCIPLYKIVQTEIILFLPNYLLQLETSGAYKIFIFKSGWYVDFKNGLNLENPITNESVDPYSPFFKTPCICLYFSCLSVSIQ